MVEALLGTCITFYIPCFGTNNCHIEVILNCIWNTETDVCEWVVGKNQSCIHDKIRSKLNSTNVYYHSVQNFLPSRLLSTICKA
jgi:hypothetical protein